MRAGGRRQGGQSPCLPSRGRAAQIPVPASIRPPPRRGHGSRVSSGRLACASRRDRVSSRPSLRQTPRTSGDPLRHPATRRRAKATHCPKPRPPADFPSVCPTLRLPPSNRAVRSGNRQTHAVRPTCRTALMPRFVPNNRGCHESRGTAPDAVSPPKRTTGHIPAYPPLEPGPRGRRGTPHANVDGCSKHGTESVSATQCRRGDPPRRMSGGAPATILPSAQPPHLLAGSVCRSTPIQYPSLQGAATAPPRGANPASTPQVPSRDRWFPAAGLFARFLCPMMGNPPTPGFCDTGHAARSAGKQAMRPASRTRRRWSKRGTISANPQPPFRLRQPVRTRSSPLRTPGFFRELAT